MIAVDLNGIERRLNYRRQPVDLRDLPLDTTPKLLHLPPKADVLHIAKPAIRDQLSLGSCTNNAGAAAMAFVWMVIVKTVTDPLFSRLFGYYVTRKVEGQPLGEDTGASVRDVFKAYRQYGICLEHTWPYDVKRFAEHPPEPAWTEALKHRALKFYSCLTLAQIKQSIADGWPVILGFDCYESLMSAEVAKTGHIPYPKFGEKPIGGHCVMVVGYDDETAELKIQNSWGSGWGDGGYGYLPYAYWTKGHASDAHTLRVEAT